MGAIPDSETDWAVVYRLGQMLEGERHHSFNITQAYALFTPILCWTMQRMRKGDPRGREFQRFLQRQPAVDAPWSIPLGVHHSRTRHLHLVDAEREDSDITTWPIEPFLIALRNAVAHADNRCVVAENDGQRLTGYRFRVEVDRRSDITKGGEWLHLRTTWKGDIILAEEDMRRLGRHLARTFCEHMTDQTDDGRRVANDRIEEVA